MTPASNTPKRPWRAAHGPAAALVGLLLALTAIVVGAGPAAAQNAVGASTLAVTNTVGVSADISAGQRLGKSVPQPDFVVATGVAAKTAESAAVDAGHAGIHQFPGVVARKSQFFDGMNLGRLSEAGDLAGVVQKNGNIRYVLRGAGEVGVDRTTGLPTDIYTVIRKPDGSVLTMFPGTSPIG